MFESATQAFRQLGSPFHLAVGLLDHAEYHAAVGEADTAQRLAAEADSIAQRLGAGPVIERAVRLADSVGGRYQLQPDGRA